MYRILRAEMVKADISVAQLASKIGVSEKTIRNKLNGETDFTWPEALAIRRIVSPKMEMEDLFQSEPRVPEETA